MVEIKVTTTTTTTTTTTRVGCRTRTWTRTSWEVDLANIADMAVRLDGWMKPNRPVNWNGYGPLSLKRRKSITFHDYNRIKNKQTKKGVHVE
jgi:hypothetical protein